MWEAHFEMIFSKKGKVAISKCQVSNKQWTTKMVPVKLQPLFASTTETDSYSMKRITISQSNTKLASHFNHSTLITGTNRCSMNKSVDDYHHHMLWGRPSFVSTQHAVSSYYNKRSWQHDSRLTSKARTKHTSLSPLKTKPQESFRYESNNTWGDLQLNQRSFRCRQNLASPLGRANRETKTLISNSFFLVKCSS